MKAFLLVFLLPFSPLLAQTNKSVKKPGDAAPKAATWSPTDSLSYSIGVQVAEYYKTQGVEKVNTEYISKAFKDVFENKPLAISEDSCNMTIQQKLKEFLANKISATKQESAAFLEKNKSRPGVVTLPDGLQYEIITKGTGPVPGTEDTVSANYVGTLLNGEEFDNSYKRGQPITIAVTGVIRGWTEALLRMPVGSKWKLFIPSDLAYGDRGAGGGQIPGGAALIFEIELLDIVHK